VCACVCGTHVDPLQQHALSRVVECPFHAL
jgi:hypothetical protein